MKKKVLAYVTFLGLVFAKYTSREDKNSRTESAGKFISRWVFSVER